MNALNMVVKLSKLINQPSVTLSAVFLGVGLGFMRLPFLDYLRAVGDFYIALLQMCVLPFLLATLPLAIRSAMTSSTGGRTVGSLTLWLAGTLAITVLVAVVVPTAVFNAMPLDPETSGRIGTLFGTTTAQVDIEFALIPEHETRVTPNGETGLMALIPANVFSALSANDSLRVVVFAVIFGFGMVISERRSGGSIFSALRHIQAVCILIFDWVNLLLPIGIVALIAPQVALLGPDVYAVLAPFACAFLAASALLLLISILLMAAALRLSPRFVFAKMLKPLALVMATRNALVCTPAALETLQEELGARREPCDLFIPIGFAIVRFGPVVYFVTATLFIGYLMGRSFTGFELVLVAMFATMASFATIGVSGVAGLAPMAVVLRPFGLSYELALPLMMIVDPIVAMVRGALNVALNCQIPVLAVGRQAPVPVAQRVPAE